MTRGMPFQEHTSEQSTASEFYTWTFPGAPVRIHLYLSVVERLAPEVRRACDVVPAHSVEIGGLLLGTADFKSSPVVEIKDYVPFLGEYRTDHKFILSDADQRKLERTLAAIREERADGLTVVGYYRSHIGTGLSLNESDLALAEAHFFDPADVLLLVKPSTDGSSTAGFFFWDNGRIDSEFTFLEFPFDARLLTGARIKPSIRERERASTGVESAESQPQVDGRQTFEAEPLSPPIRDRRGGPKPPWLWYPLFTVLLIALGAVGYQALLKWAGPATGEATVASDPLALALRVERKDNDLRVSWNRKATAVIQAKEAALSIHDGDAQQQELRLNIEQLRNGSVLYTPANASVQFRLEVTASDNTKTSESVLALTAPKPGAAALAKPVTVSRPAPADPPAGDSLQDRRGLTPPGAKRNSGEPVRSVMVNPPAQPPEASKPSQAAVRDPLLAPNPQRPGVAAPASSTQPSPAPSASTYVAARPIRQTQPVLPAGVRRLIASAVEVDVKVQIDETGRVVKADPLPSRRPVSSSLVGAARSAALQWSFEPARRGNQPVPSDLVLRFQYRPAGPQ
jgi:hypothetical protein